MSAVAASAVVASAGPVAGGLLAASDWRRGQSPAVLLAWPAGLRLLPRTGPVRTGPVRTGPVRTGPVRTGPVYGERRRLDPLSTLLVLLGTGCLTTACVEAADRGYGAPATLGFLAVDLVMGASAVAHVRRHPDPVVDPALFRTRAFTAATLGLLSYFLTYAAPILAATPLFTGAWGRSSARAGLSVTPWPLTVLVVSMLSGRIVRAPGERTTAVVGGLCFAAGPVWWLLPAGGDGAHYVVGFMPGLVLTGVGAGLYQPVMYVLGRWTASGPSAVPRLRGAHDVPAGRLGSGCRGAGRDHRGRRAAGAGRVARRVGLHGGDRRARGRRGRRCAYGSSGRPRGERRIRHGPATAPLTCPCQLPSVLTGPWVLRRHDDDELSGEGG
ncbi:MFS transporter [Streptomyces antimycoticus]|uniref:hypothetical protein n=1 Tax=Streptomyces antimycoticus TaxID=68175 RepID=UPI0036C9AA4D